MQLNSRIQISMTCVRYGKSCTVMGKKGLTQCCTERIQCCFTFFLIVDELCSLITLSLQFQTKGKAAAKFAKDSEHLVYSTLKGTIEYRKTWRRVLFLNNTRWKKWSIGMITSLTKANSAICWTLESLFLRVIRLKLRTLVCCALPRLQLHPCT